MRRLFGILIVVAILWHTTVSSAKQYAPVFVDIPSAAIVLLVTFGNMLSCSKKGDFGLLFNFWAGKKQEITNDQATSLCNLLKCGARSAIAAGFIGTIIGFIIILMNMSDIDNTAPAIAVALITILYGLILSELCFMPGYRLINRRFNLKNDCTSRSN